MHRNGIDLLFLVRTRAAEPPTPLLCCAAPVDLDSQTISIKIIQSSHHRLCHSKRLCDVPSALLSTSLFSLRHSVRIWTHVSGSHCSFAMRNGFVILPALLCYSYSCLFSFQNNQWHVFVCCVFLSLLCFTLCPTSVKCCVILAVYTAGAATQQSLRRP